MFEKIFDINNPVWTFMGKVADVIILNILFIVFSIPIVTIGASWTALYYVSMRIVKKESAYILKEFWQSFKGNFKQATQIWLICLVVIGIFSGDVLIWYSYPDMLPVVVKGITVVLLVVALSTMVYVFPMLSKFDNTNINLIKNSLLVSLVNVPSTVLFIIMLAVPFVLALAGPNFFIPLLMVGFSLPVLISSLVMVRIFRKFDKSSDVVTEEAMGNGDAETSGERESDDNTTTAESKEET